MVAPSDEIEGTGAVLPTRIPCWRLVVDQAGVTREVASYPYPGSGTVEDPYRIQWIPNDPRNPMLFSKRLKWFMTFLAAFATLAVALVSSAPSASLAQVIAEFNVTSEVATLGVSIFVLGFAIGPLFWAPLSEMFGRQWLFIASYGALSAFNAGIAGAQNITTFVVLRFLAGAFGSSPLTNAGGLIADMFPASERGLAMTIFAGAPFLGPILGPVVGGFVGMNAGWRWVEGVLAIFCGTLWILGSLMIPETYSLVILRRRAAKLSRMTGRVYESVFDAEQGRVTMRGAFKTALSRPWILLFQEPIVILLSIYMAIVYGTLYMLFAAFPIVYGRSRGWNEGISGLAFLGILVGMLIGMSYTFWDNKRYLRVQKQHAGWAPPEARLPPCLGGCVVIPIGMFWFAWTNGPSIHWLVSIVASAPFGLGMVLVFLPLMNYLIDSYTIFAASVLAASAVLRALFGAFFPLFTGYMYQNLGLHWAASVPAFLSAVCIPFPFLFYKYGESIRARCKFSAQSIAFTKRLQEQAQQELSVKGPSMADPPSGDGEKTILDLSSADPIDSGPVSSIRRGGSLRSFDNEKVNTQQLDVSPT